MPNERNSMNEQDWEINQYENAAEYVRIGHSISEAAIEFEVEEAALVRFIQNNAE